MSFPSPEAKSLEESKTTHVMWKELTEKEKGQNATLTHLEKFLGVKQYKVGEERGSKFKNTIEILKNYFQTLYISC